MSFFVSKLVVAHTIQNVLQLLEPVVLLVLEQIIALQLTLNLGATDGVILVFPVQRCQFFDYVLELTSLLLTQHSYGNLVDSGHDVFSPLLETQDVAIDLCGFILVSHTRQA